MKKLVFLTTNIDNSGGVAKLLSVKLNYLKKSFGYHIDIINSNDILNGVFYHFDKGITIHTLGSNKTTVTNVWAYRKNLKRLLAKLKPDIIVNCDNGLKGALLPFLINQRTTLIYENHNTFKAKGISFKTNLKLKLSFILLSLSAKKYYRIIVYPHQIKEWGSNNIMAISNPLLIDPVESGALLNNKTAIAVGRISYQKNYENLLGGMATGGPQASGMGAEDLWRR